MIAYDYIKDPKAIYKHSFELVEASCDLSAFNEGEAAVVKRLVHSVGRPEIADVVRFSVGAVDVGLTALENDKPILCDAEMVAAGITQTGDNQPICLLNHRDLPDLVTTRSARAVELWPEFLDGAIVAIGNAPTALFHLLEGLANKHWPRPALIVGMPVGFVGAAESKQALMESDQNFIVVEGREGGSPLASAAVNALGLLATQKAQG